LVELRGFGTSYNFGCWSRITAILWAVSVTESVALPPYGEHHQMTKASEFYRAKALACEKLSLSASTYEAKCEWKDLATEWHAFASRVAQEADKRALETT
jgi:hypothetical protein